MQNDTSKSQAVIVEDVAFTQVLSEIFASKRADLVLVGVASFWASICIALGGEGMPETEYSLKCLDELVKETGASSFKGEIHAFPNYSYEDLDQATQVSHFLSDATSRKSPETIFLSVSRALISNNNALSGEAKDAFRKGILLTVAQIHEYLRFHQESLDKLFRSSDNRPFL